MASNAVMTAVRARLTANWSHCPVDYPNEQSSVPSDNSAVLDVSYPISRAEQITIGTPGKQRQREEGAIRFALLVPVGLGLSPYMSWIDDLRALFLNAQFSGVNCWQPSSPATLDGSDTGGYFMLSCACPYYFDATG